MSLDPFTPAQRAAIMRAVKSNDTTPERIVRSAAHALGFRFRLGGRGLPGRPDLVFVARRKAIFVHGCFWHGHACKRGARAPKTNAAYWQAKIARNRARDAAALSALKALQWRALVVWECETRNGDALKSRFKRFLDPK